MGQQIFVFISLLLYGLCIAGPVRDDPILDTTSSDSVCTVKNMTYSRGDEIPNVAPCETCICEPPNINCSMIKCQQNNGCKIIQQPNKCCPDYKCDCEYGGKTYNNGEKLDNPSNPCQVCYCRGGEIMCNSITCYRRDDCEPQHVEGQCCPKYGHCPTKNSSSVIAVPGDPSILSTKREMQPWLLTKPMTVETKETHKYPQTIKIVEILPTQNPPKSGEVSLVPRIITNGSPQEFKLSSPYQPVTESCTEGCSSSSSEEAPEPSAEPTVVDNSESGEPDSETVTKLWAHSVDSTTDEDESAALTSAVTEGSGYEILTGGTFLPGITKEDDDSSEESKEEETNDLAGITTDNALTNANTIDSNGTEPQKSADIKVELTEQGDYSEVTESSYPTSSSSDTVTNGEAMVTRHGLTIPPVLKLNQVDHLTLPNAADESESRSVVQVGVYDPTKPDEQSNLVTVIKNDERSMGSTVSSTEGETTQLLLTPEDLKTLAEIIIKEKIKPPKEELRLGADSTTPLAVEISEPISTAGVELTEKSDFVNDITGTSRDKTVEETTTAHYVGGSSVNPMLHELTKEEEKAQRTVPPTEPSVTETALPTSGNILQGNKDVEWVGETNSSNRSEIVDNDVENATTQVVDTTTVDNVKYTTTAHSDNSESSSDATTRGALRHMDSYHTTSLWKSTDQIKSGPLRTKPTHSALLDENDRIIVANFFRKALNFH